MATTLTINGVSYTAAQRAAAQVWLDSWGWDLDGDSSCIFQEIPAGMGMVPRWKGGQSVSVDVGGTTRFAGEIISAQPSFTDQGWVYSYRCGGFKYQVNKRLFVTAVDGSGTMVWNLPADDIDYIAANSGLSVGQILDAIITQHSADLATLGISTDATTTAQLAALTLVPNIPVYAQGPLVQAMQGVLMAHAKNVAMQITPDGLMRFWDTTAGTDISLELGTDPIDPPIFTRDVSRCASRVVVRGLGQIYPGYVSLLSSSLTPSWSGPQQTAWTYADYSQPSDAYDKGTIAPGGITSPTTVVVSSSDATRTWALNFWSGRQAWIYLHSSVGTGLTYTESRPVTANTALTAAGTSTITLSFDLDNAGANAYDSYELIGSYAPLGSSGRNNVYRLFDVTDPGGQIANHMVKRFPVSVPFVNQTGTIARQTLYPCALIVQGLNAWPATFKVMPATGQLLFDEPVVKSLNSMSTLNTGGGGVTTPDDIYVLLAYSRGALTAVYPPDVAGVPQYDGTSYTVEGLADTTYIDVDSWIYKGNQANLDAYAQMMHASVCDTVVTGVVNYKGAYSAAYAPNVRLSVTGQGGFTTGLETLKVPVRSFTLRYHADGQGGLNYSSQLNCSSHRNPATGDRQFVHTTQPAQTQFKFDFGSIPGLDQLSSIPGLGGIPNLITPALDFKADMGAPNAGPVPSFATPDARDILSTLGITL